MVRIRKTAPVNPPEPDLAIVVANLQRQLLEQQQETNRLREQLAQLNQRPLVNEVPPPADQVPPVAPPVPDIPRNDGIPIASAGVPVDLPPVREELLYERFRRMKAPEFDGTMDPIAADNWLIDIQVILDFMWLTEQEKVLCASFALKKDARHWWITVQMRRDVTAMSWQDFVAEFRTMYYNREVLAVQQDEFANLKQGTMTVMEAVKKFEQLERLCPELVPSETEKDKEARAQIFKAKKEEKAIVKLTQPRQSAESNQKGQTNNPAQVREETSGHLQNGDPCVLSVRKGGAFCKELHSEQSRSESSIPKPECQQSASCSPSQTRRTFHCPRQIGSP
ncbi:hypothetical protein TIFTF001_046452 [Ficus carica]|uniref:Retrotransposon gag domain-containing protein n=1 Tax=Ficus carica TaxID=3494 RepID=A0AA87ZQ81_FICCA|nr:hypothetical protein TIFTF001_046450 [Ficus carica]GMN30766.1 hypothetical protein TIFTF001_046452 [Ficus carica]